ncbi:MAG: alpha/beta hydrolase family protein [Pirellulaceae bacterium]|nr:alpha/beta hydrolase family protein [Pirellulaceae bacterium]
MVLLVFLAIICSLAYGQVQVVDRDIAAAMKAARPAMQFRGATAAEFSAWKKEFRAKLNELLGDSTPPRTWRTKEVERTEFTDHVRLQLLLEADGIPALPVYLLVPKGVSSAAKRPGVLCIHGHGAYGYHPIAGRRDLPGVAENIEKHNYDYGVQFVRRGYVVAAPCMIPFGPRVDRERYGGNDPCAVSFVRMQAIGRLPMTANLRDLRWALNLLEQHELVDGSKLGAAGLSYGGRMTMLVTAMDERVKVAAVSGALNLLQERMTLRHSCGSQLIPGLLLHGDYSEIGSLIAPRPCVWETGSTDSLIVPEWDELFRSRLRRAYQAAGHVDDLHFDRFEGGHVWSGKIAFPLFDQTLKSP